MPKPLRGLCSPPAWPFIAARQRYPADLIPWSSIVCGDLSHWTPPSTGKVAIDVALGRIAFAPGEAPREGITVSYTYGFSGTWAAAHMIAHPAQLWLVIPARPSPASVDNPASAW